MKGLVVTRLVTHILVLLGIVAFFASFPAMLPGLLMSTVRIDLLVQSCGRSATTCLALPGLWVVVIVAIVTLRLDLRMLRNRDGLDGRLWRSLALELLLPAGWYACLRAMGGSDVVGPAWFVMPGPPILLSAIASAVVAWLLIADQLKTALNAVTVWIERAIAVVLTAIAGALTYVFANLLISQF